MVERKFKKWQLAFIVGLIFIIPLIVLFQYTKADIIINIDEDFKNQCFFGQPVCVYDQEIRIFSSINTGKEIEFRELSDEWRIIGENVFCFKVDGSFAEPVANPVGIVTEKDDVTCNNIASFEKNDWDLRIDFLIPDEQGNLITFSSIEPPEGSINRFTFTMKGI